MKILNENIDDAALTEQFGDAVANLVREQISFDQEEGVTAPGLKF